MIKAGHLDELKKFEEIIRKIANLSDLSRSMGKTGTGSTFLVGATELFIPLDLDEKAESDNVKKEIEHLKGFLAIVDKKLSNEKFVSGAPPQVLELERKKKADAESKLASLEASLSYLNL